MRALFAGLTTVDTLHGLDHTPDPTLKTTSTDFLLAAGGPATNAAATYAALARVASLPQNNAEASAAPRSAQTSQSALPPRNHPALLLTALGRGALAEVLREDLTTCGVEILDATDTSDPAGQCFPAVSAIIDHPTGRMVASTNARVPISTDAANVLLSNTDSRTIGAILIDGHNPDLANLALTWHDEPAPSHEPDTAQPLRPARTPGAPPRILDGGSWKPWLPPLLANIDIAVISADFAPPLCEGIPRDTPAFANAVADFLRGFGIRHIVRTRGAESIQWWWGGTSGETAVPQVNATSTLGAGDIFHGAFTWALTHWDSPPGVQGRAAAQAPGAKQAPGATLEHTGDQTGTDSTHSAPTWENITNPTPVLDFAAQVAALSTTHFGTRSWMSAPALHDLVVAYLSTTQEAQ